jgi:phosphohistidine phosphatase
MFLYLIQHAHAKNKDEDPERGLTDLGISAIKKTGGFLFKLNPQISKIWTTGKKRAEQTSMILSEQLNVSHEHVITVKENLNPKDDVLLIAGELDKIKHENIIIVGHLPHLSRLAAQLLTNQQEMEVIRFKNAGIVCLARVEDLWTLEWMITPGIIR